MVVRHISVPTLAFFMLQAVAITVEDLLFWSTKSWRPQLGLVNRVVGYLWVIFWFTLSYPMYLDLMNSNDYGSGGILYGHVTHSVREILFGRVLDLIGLKRNVN